MTPVPVAPRGFIAVVPGSHNPWTALIMAIVFPPLGSLFNKQYSKAIMKVVVIVLIGLGNTWWMNFAVWIIYSIDSFMIAQRLNRGEMIKEHQSF